MADGLTRLRISLAQREFEVEGSETFVKTYAARFEALLDRLHQPDEVAGAAAPPPPVQVDRGPPEAGTFGELLQHLPRAASDVDRILVAGSFAQSRTADKSFSTGEANALLTEQGIKVGNPSQCVKQNLVAKRVFKHLGRYRISQSGAEHLRQLLSPALRE